MHEFRVNRISKIIANDLVTILSAGGRMAMHFLPLSAFARTTGVDLRALGDDPRPLVDLIGGFSHSRFNADGFVGWSKSGYAQVFRNGSIEVVTIFSNPDVNQNATRYLPSVSFEQRIFTQVNSAKRILPSLLTVRSSGHGFVRWYQGMAHGCLACICY